MKRFFLVPIFALFLTTLQAQTSQEQIKQNPNLSASGYYAYPNPTQKQLTPAPKDYEAVYISHYGRHGSRFIIGEKAYQEPYQTMLKADSLGKLTALGKSTLYKLKLIKNEAHLRDGELTPLGAEQHCAIANRMYQRFPTVFQGNASIDAKSTIIIRCILSMENALQTLLRHNNKLTIKHDASQHDMDYMGHTDLKLQAKAMTGKAKEAYEAFSKQHENYENVMQRLFSDADYWHNNIDVVGFGDQLFVLASNVQSTELRHQLSLYDVFTPIELYDAWLRNNAWWYINYGPSPLNGGTQIYSQRKLLRKIIAEADSCLSLQKPGATLRFGHDTMVMPLTCLLDINGYGKQIEDLELLDDENWLNYNIFPMACNLQLVFYQSKKQPNDILVKVLQNENEATLPLQTNIFPYYRWADFKTYYLHKIDQYEQENP